METRSSRSRQLTLAMIAFAVLALFFGMWTSYNHRPTQRDEINLKNGTILPIPRDISPFKLVKSDISNGLDRFKKNKKTKKDTSIEYKRMYG